MALGTAAWGGQPESRIVLGKRPAINLASGPFENRRPISRVKWLFLLLGVLLWGVVAVKFWDYAAGSSEETRNQLMMVEAEIAELSQQLDQAERRLQAAEIEQRNERTMFLNTKLGERAFPWSRLFQDLAAAQPRGVRLRRVTPDVEESEEESGLPNFAKLSLDGIAQERDIWYVFVDKLFEHESFVAPEMLSESEEDEGGTDFRLDVLYRTGLAGPGSTATTEGLSE